MNLPEGYKQPAGTMIAGSRLKCGSCRVEEEMNACQTAGALPVMNARSDWAHFMHCHTDSPFAQHGPWYEIPTIGFFCLKCAQRMRKGMLDVVGNEVAHT